MMKASITKQSPNFLIEYLTQNAIFHVKVHVTKVLRIINTKITTSHVTKLDMK